MMILNCYMSLCGVFEKNICPVAGPAHLDCFTFAPFLGRALGSAPRLQQSFFHGIWNAPPGGSLPRGSFFLGHWNSCNEPSFTSTSFHGTIYKTVGSERWESTHMKNDIRSMSEWMYYSHSNPFWHKLYVSFYDSAHITTFCSTKRLIPSHQQTSPCTWPVACVVSWQVPHGCRRGIPLQILLMRLCLDIYLYWTTKKAWLMIVLSSSHAG